MIRLIVISTPNIRASSLSSRHECGSSRITPPATALSPTSLRAETPLSPRAPTSPRAQIPLSTRAPTSHIAYPRSHHGHLRPQSVNHAHSTSTDFSQSITPAPASSPGVWVSQISHPTSLLLTRDIRLVVKIGYLTLYCAQNYVLTMDNSANSMTQVATPEMVMLHEHVIPYTHKFPTSNPNYLVSSLIGTHNTNDLETTVPVPHKNALSIIAALRFLIIKSFTH